MATVTKIKGHSEVTGQLEGEMCSRNGCAGVIVEAPVENCSCHINPPCGACTTPREHCPECGWQAKNDELPINGFLVRPANPVGAWSSYRERPLDPTKIDWRTKSHTHFSMVKEGIMPAGTTTGEVLEVIGAGTFGGRFDQFIEGQDGKPGRFRYIAYTD